MDAHMKRLQGEIVGIRASIVHFDKVVAQWRPETEAALALLARRAGKDVQVAAEASTRQISQEMPEDDLGFDAAVDETAPGHAG